MKWPWVRRAEDAEARVVDADEKLAEAQAKWPHVTRVTGEAMRHRELNGWTATVQTIFAGNTSERGRRA